MKVAFQIDDAATPVIGANPMTPAFAALLFLVKAIGVRNVLYGLVAVADNQAHFNAGQHRLDEAKEFAAWATAIEDCARTRVMAEIFGPLRTQQQIFPKSNPPQT